MAVSAGKESGRGDEAAPSRYGAQLNDDPRRLAPVL